MGSRPRRPSALSASFGVVSPRERRQAALFFADLLGRPPRRDAGAPPSADGEDEPSAWTPPQERVFREWWKKIAGFEGPYDQWKRIEANRFDRGGETNWGITWNTYRNMHRDATKAQFQAMSLDEAMGIARRLYRLYKADQIADPGVALLITDWQWGGVSKKAVNRALVSVGQPAVANFTATGPDQATVDALNAPDPQQMIGALDRERLQAIKDDIAAHPEQAVYEKGWTNRAITRWVQAKMLTGRPGDAARWLNGQSRDKLAELFAWLTSEEIAALHEAALTAPGVGPGSRFARITKARHDAWTTAAR